MRQTKLNLLMILAVLILGFVNTSKAVSQTETPVYASATWSPTGLSFAMVDYSGAHDAVQIFTRELQPTVRLTLENLPDGITQVDAVTWIDPKTIEIIARDLAGMIITRDSDSLPDEWYFGMGETDRKREASEQTTDQDVSQQ